MQALESSRPSLTALSCRCHASLGAVVCRRARGWARDLVLGTSCDTSLCHLPWSQTFPSAFSFGKQAWELVLEGVSTWPACRAVVKNKVITFVKVLCKSPSEVIYCVNSSCSDRSQSLVSSWENLVRISWFSFFESPGVPPLWSRLMHVTEDRISGALPVSLKSAPVRAAAGELTATFCCSENFPSDSVRSVRKWCEMFRTFIYFLHLGFVAGKRDVRVGDERQTKNPRKFTLYLELFNFFSFWKPLFKDDFYQLLVI